jgi:hypothetical protein
MRCKEKCVMRCKEKCVMRCKTTQTFFSRGKVLVFQIVELPPLHMRMKIVLLRISIPNIIIFFIVSSLKIIRLLTLTIFEHIQLYITSSIFVFRNYLYYKTGEIDDLAS